MVIDEIESGETNSLPDLVKIVSTSKFFFTKFLSKPNVLYADIVGSAYVIDGDTIKINDTRVRLNGIDTPESQQTCNRKNK